MENSQSLFERSLKVAPGGVHSPVRAFKSVGGNPLFFDRAEGASIISVEGKSYIDFCQSFGPNILGHRDPEVAQAVQETLSKAWTLGACDPYSLELAEWIQEEIPWAERLRFVCSGTEAVMSALRLARGATGRSKILKFEGCYHGHVDSMLVKAGSGLVEGETASDSAGVSQSVAETTLLAPLDSEEAVHAIFSEHSVDIAAVIIEPLPANFGLLPQRKEFLKFVIEAARSNGSLVIFDEVISGFRVALGGMAELLGEKPDLVTYGKIMGGGFPVGCYAGKAKYLDQMAPVGPVYQAGTLAANPVGMTAGLATLKKAQRENVYEVLEGRAATFCGGLNAHCREKGWPIKVAREGSLFWMHFNDSENIIRSTKGFSSKMPEVYRAIFHGCLERGVYLAPSAYEVGFLSLAHTESILSEAQSVITESIDQVFERKS